MSAFFWMCQQGYFLASFLFLGVVFALPVALGSAALALDLPVSTDEALGGLVMPAAAYVLVGKAGALYMYFYALSD